MSTKTTKKAEKQKAGDAAAVKSIAETKKRLDHATAMKGEAEPKSEFDLLREERAKVQFNPGDILWDADIEQHGVVVAQHETVIVYRGKGSEKVGPGMVGQYIEVCDLVSRADAPSAGRRFVIEKGARVQAVPCGWDKDEAFPGTVHEVCDVGCWVHFDDGVIDGDPTSDDGWRIRPCMWEHVRPLLDHGLDVYTEAMAKKSVEAA